MLEDAQYYRSLHDVNFGNWTKQELVIAGALRALMLFRVRQQVPCTLSLVRAYRKKLIKKNALEEALCTIENFHFQFTAITSQRSSGGISGMSAALGRRLFSANDSQEVANIIKDIKEKLSERVPSESEFTALFPELLYTNTLSKQRALVKYVMVKIAKHEQVALPGDWDELTIEHVVPQASINDGIHMEEVVGQLGNLLLVPSTLNEKLKDKPFSQKKKILVNANYPLPDEMAEAADWSPAKIKERTNRLALQAFQKVWRV